MIWLCKIGLHAWGTWRASTVPGGYEIRKCACCKRTMSKYGYPLFWDVHPDYEKEAQKALGKRGLVEGLEQEVKRLLEENERLHQVIYTKEKLRLDLMIELQGCSTLQDVWNAKARFTFTKDVPYIAKLTRAREALVNMPCDCKGDHDHPHYSCCDRCNALKEIGD